MSRNCSVRPASLRPAAYRPTRFNEIFVSRLELKHVEQFEDDDDNDNYSDYVEDTSVHAVD